MKVRAGRLEKCAQLRFLVGADSAAAILGQAATSEAACWKPERVAVDLDLSRRLAAVLDAEKGISDSPFAASVPAAEPLGNALPFPSPPHA